MKVIIFMCFISVFGLVSSSYIGDFYTTMTKTEIRVEADQLTLKANIGLVYYENKPFSGISVKRYNLENVAETKQYREGVKNGEMKKWFADGSLSYEANYTDGKLHGTSKSWWKNGEIRSQSNHIDGKAEGEQKQWYKSGAMFKVINLENGTESGLQQSWRENGKIYNNYEAKDGRIFGLKRANLCYELDNENLKQ